MLLAVVLGTSLMANANTIPVKTKSSTEVKANVVRKHRVAKKVKTVSTKIAKPVSQTPKNK